MIERTINAYIYIYIERERDCNVLQYNMGCSAHTIVSLSFCFTAFSKRQSCSTADAGFNVSSSICQGKASEDD